MSETHYLCRVPSTGIVILLREQDYRYQRNHEERLYIPDEKYNMVLLAQGSKADMMMLKNCFEGELTNVS